MNYTNDIYILYKRTDATKDTVTAFKNKLTASHEEGKTTKVVTLKDFVIKDYDDTLLAEESYFEGSISRLLLCFIDDEFFYDANCRAIWSAFMSRQRNSEAQLVFPVLIEDIVTNNFDISKKEIYIAAETLGFYSIKDEAVTEALRLAITESLKTELELNE